MFSPEILEQIYFGNAVRDYVVVSLLIVAGFLLTRNLRRLISYVLVPNFAKMGFQAAEHMVKAMSGPLSGMFFLAVLYLASLLLHLPPGTNIFLRKTVVLASIFLGGIIGIRLLDLFFVHWMQPLARSSQNKLDDQLVLFGRRVSKVIFVMLLFLFMLDQAGLDVASLLAGLGIGGLAVALSAQETLGNVLGSLQIMTDRPFAVGDFVRSSGHFGEVVDIGLRSTKMMTRSGVRVVIPNKKIAENEIENVSVHGNLAVELRLGLVYDTTADELQNACDIMAEILQSEASILNNYIIQFAGFGESSLDIHCTYFVVDLRNYWNVQHRVNLEVKRQFDEAKLGFAFPTRTLYMVPPSGG